MFGVAGQSRWHGCYVMQYFITPLLLAACDGIHHTSSEILYRNMTVVAVPIETQHWQYTL